MPVPLVSRLRPLGDRCRLLRPAQPVAFIQDYFKNVIRGSSPLLRSYRYIRFTEQGRSTFMDNLAASYGALETQKGRGGHSGISALEYTRLVKSLCRDFPDEMLEGVLGILQVEEGEVVGFQEFAAGINACLYYSDFLDNAEDLYHKCAGSCGGVVKTEQYIVLLRQLRLTRPELVMPNEDEVLAASGRDTTISFETFVSNIFALTTLRPP